jgi:hypothetical protein
MISKSEQEKNKQIAEKRMWGKESMAEAVEGSIGMCSSYQEEEEGFQSAWEVGRGRMGLYLDRQELCFFSRVDRNLPIFLFLRGDWREDSR